MLKWRCVLIVEDEVLVAHELAVAVAEAEGVAIGPVHTVEEALAVLEREWIDAAILDVQLDGKAVTPVAKALLDQGGVVVFHAASPAPEDIVRDYADVAVCPKPTLPNVVVRRLIETLDAAGRTP